MSGRRSRSKGKRGERELVQLLRDVWPEAARGWQSRSGDEDADVEGTPYWWESKRQARPNIHGAVAQARRDTDGRPIVVASRRDREGWLATMDLSVFLRLCAELAALRAKEADDE